MEPLLVLTGVVAGVLAGLLGIGGGVLMTPVLHFALGRPWGEAVALSLFAIAIQAPLGVHQHARRGAVDWRMAVPMAAAGLVGVAVGDRLLPALDVALVQVLFAALMAFAAWRMVARAPDPVVTAPPPWVLALLGAVAGLASRLFGIGGGLLTVPALTLLGVRPHVAVGTSLVPVAVTAGVASGATLARGLAPAAGLLLASGALVGVTVGVRLAHALPAATLRRVFAVALALAAVSIAVSAAP